MWFSQQRSHFESKQRTSESEHAHRLSNAQHDKSPNWQMPAQNRYACVFMASCRLIVNQHTYRISNASGVTSKVGSHAAEADGQCRCESPSYTVIGALLDVAIEPHGEETALRKRTDELATRRQAVRHGNE